MSDPTNFKPIKWDASMVKAAHEECDRIYETVLNELSESLNETHRIAWNRLQYEKLLGNWLISLIHILCDRWKSSNELSKTESGLFIPPSDINSFQRDAVADAFNNLLCQQITLLKNGDFLPNTHYFSQKVQCVSHFSISTKVNSPVHIHEPYHSFGQSRWKNKLLGLTIPKNLENLTSLLTFDDLQIDEFDTLKTWRLSNVKKEASSLEEACKILAPLYLPAVFLEGFNSLRKASLSAPGIKVLFTATSIHENIPFKYLGAEISDNTLLLCHQHGGGYGIQERCVPEDYERSISNVFYTWGWKENENTRLLPAPPRISKPRVNKRRKILFKCIEYPRYVYRIMYETMGTQMNSQIADTIKFLREVTDCDIEISHYPHKYGWQVRERFSNAGISFPDKRHSDSYYALHTANYMGTSWLESLAADIPTICFFDPQITSFRANVSPYIEDLIRLGILNTSPEAAAAKVKEVCNNPDTWWRTDDLQDIRKSFVEKYALLKDDWQESWRDEFSQFVN